MKRRLKMEKTMTGLREAENTARQLHNVFGSRVDDDTVVPLGDVDYFRTQYAYTAKSSTNFLLDIIFKLSEQIADLRHTVQAMQPKEIDEPKKCEEPVKPSSDIVSHPNHYDTHAKECIVEMYILFGVDKFIDFCTMNAWKYRYRAGSKQGSPAAQDNAKADRYIEYAKRAKGIDYGLLDPTRLTDDEYWSKREI